jgi:hypothetical protein
MLNNFIDKLPKKPYSTDDYNYGMKPRKKENALKLRYLQPNGPTHRHWLTFDVDRKNSSAVDWYDLDCPAPNITIKNPENGKAHLIYALETSVRTAPDGSMKALKYAAAVEAGLTFKLKADLGYNHVLLKNPAHDHWVTNVWHDDFYTLDELADWVDLPSIDLRKKAANEAFGLGKNCILFENLRQWAYMAIRRSGFPEYDVWLNMCIDHAEKTNGCFTEPMGFNEIKATARSVARWTHGRFTKAGFSAIQSARGKLGGRPSLGNPWEALDISRATYFRQKKSGLILPD